MNIKPYHSPLEVAHALAEEVFVQGTAAGDLHVAISGGGTPRLLFEVMATEALAHRINWQRLHLYWVDERCVPPMDPQSNYGMTHAALLDKVPLPEEQIHRIHGESDPQSEARRYTHLVQEQLPKGGQGGVPRFDVVLLGIGDDGHTSSIFPHQMDLLTEQTPYVVAHSPVGQPRICMTGGTILGAGRVIFHAVGAGKRALLEQIHRTTPESRAYPAAYFVRERPDIELYTDQPIG